MINSTVLYVNIKKAIWFHIKLVELFLCSLALLLGTMRSKRRGSLFQAITGHHKIKMTEIEVHFPVLLFSICVSQDYVIFPIGNTRKIRNLIKVVLDCYRNNEFGKLSTWLVFSRSEHKTMHAMTGFVFG